MPEVVSPQKKRSSTGKVQLTPDSKVADNVTSDGSLNKNEEMETLEMEFKSPEVKDLKQKSLKDQVCVTESTCSESKEKDTEFSSLYPETKDFESRSLNSEPKITGPSPLNSKSKKTKSNSLIGEETEVETPNEKIIKIVSLHSTPAASGVSNKRGLSPTEEPLKPVEKKKRAICSDKSVQVSDKMGSFNPEDKGKTYLATLSSQNPLVKDIFEKANPLPDMLKFEGSIQTFMLGSQFKLDPDSVCTPEKLSKMTDSGGKLLEFWKTIKENLWNFYRLVQTVVPKFGPFSKLTPEELKDCINGMKKSTNKMRDFNEVCVKELRNWWNLTKVFDSIFFLEALLYVIYSRVKKLESKSLADKNSELNSSVFKCRRMSSKTTSNVDSKSFDSPSLTTEDSEMKSPNGAEKREKTSSISTPVVNCPTNEGLSVNEPSNHLKKKKLMSSVEMNQILKQLLHSADETLTSDVLSSQIQNAEALDILEKVNLFPTYLKFERTIETFLFYSEIGPEFIFKLESNPHLYQLWKETEGAVLDFKNQVKDVIAELGPLCELTLTDLRECVCTLKILTNKMKEPRKSCFKELKKWWNLTQVFNNLFNLEASLNDIFSKVKELEINV